MNKRPTVSSRKLARNYFQRPALGAEIFNAQAWAPKMYRGSKKALTSSGPCHTHSTWKLPKVSPHDFVKVAHHYKDRSHLRARSQNMIKDITKCVSPRNLFNKKWPSSTNYWGLERKYRVYKVKNNIPRLRYTKSRVWMSQKIKNKPVYDLKTKVVVDTYTWSPTQGTR